jgi:hypothetical protein
MFSSFTGTSEIHPILSLAVFHGGGRTFLERFALIFDFIYSQGNST